MATEKLTPERAVRLLRAKAGELEARVLQDLDSLGSYPDRLAHVTYAGQSETRLAELAADIALVATLLADFIEYSGMR